MPRKLMSTPAPVNVKVVIALALSVAALSCAVAAWFVLAPARPARPPGGRAAQGPYGEQPLESEMVTIRPWGFEPKEINRPAGRFFLAVVNRSGFLDADISLNRVAGNSRQLVPVRKGNKGWRQEVDLPPGEYVLTEVNHEGWSCTITLSHR